MSTTTLPDSKRLRAALKGEKPPIRFERIGFLSQAGELRKIAWSEPTKSLAENWTFGNLLKREDYDLDDDGRPGQRGVYEEQVKKIADGIRTTSRPYLGTLVVGMEPDEEFVEIEIIQEVMPGVSLARITVREGAPVVWSVDGQHREFALDRVWKLVKDAEEGDALVVRRYLEQSATEITLLLEGDPDILATLFVKMGSTKPIDPSLIAVMDKENASNRLGQYVIRNARLCAGRVGYLPDSAHKRRDPNFAGLYKAAGVRSAASAIAGVGVRDRTPKDREKHLAAVIRKRVTATGLTGNEALTAVGAEVVELLDLAFERIPGWRELSKNTLTVPEFRKRYLHSATAGLHVIANVIAAARIAGVDPRKVVDALAELPWQRDALRTIPEDKKAGIEEYSVHVFFEGTLAKTAYDDRALCWRAGASGATRSNYEMAIKTVLRHIATKHPDLHALDSDATFTELGLIARRSVGRPRKATVVPAAAK
ncbi:DNA sulfur modification protein DndB [Streptomyces galbus]|uniref:DGQHR domain-containing protein n=1 Tax=Streptomyces galbus TaxID=33898 RepID=A0A4V6AUH5_STRGB|nr:DNA sulfur modification protein DndB [Streptomyces galbus]TKS96032.1 hypothetical protein E4U92_34740 [Streptomyces galbus]GHD52177.1 hypothetical protein GCM10010335_64280 [Streptomyces galbus]